MYDWRFGTNKQYGPAEFTLGDTYTHVVLASLH